VAPGLRQEYFGERSAVAQEFSFDCLFPEVLATDLTRTARSFEVPVHFILGRYDQGTPVELAVEYFEVVEAPSKQLHWFENSAHMIPVRRTCQVQQAGGGGAPGRALKFRLVPRFELAPRFALVARFALMARTALSAGFVAGPEGKTQALVVMDLGRQMG
jgi:hypothetical protein